MENKEHNAIPGPFSPEAFRKEGHQLVDRLADYLGEALASKEMPVLPWRDPDELTSVFARVNNEDGEEPFDVFTEKVIRMSNHLHHPRYIGHQVTTPLPLTSLVQLCTSLLNNGAAVYEMGPVAMAMERSLVKYFGELIGYEGNYDGIFTHGGSAGNLTAMLAARQSMSDYNIWEEGIREGDRPGFIVSEQSHYGIARNIKIMGLGDKSVIRIGYDPDFRMKTGDLDACLEAATRQGIKVVAVVANSCSTATGTYDDLEAIGKFCRANNLWMHVDGAHGLGVLFSDKYRHLVKGLNMADSIVIDFHKMLLVGGLNTLVLFRNADRSFETFSQKATYLFRKNINNEWYNSAKRTLECTKSALGVVAYTAVKYYGKSYYKEYIDSRYDLASDFSKKIRESADFELAVTPSANIVCFRYNPGNKTNEELNSINALVRDRIIKGGRFYIVQTEIEGKLWLRITIINPVTALNDLLELTSHVREIAESI
ncbi:MAG: aminotransferase class V-fold PLP-dependent enzyme [Bacteroidales bacterium]